MGVSVGSRAAGTGRFLLCCVLALAAFGTMTILVEPPAAYAQGADDKDKAPESAKETPDFFTHLIKSAGIFFGPLLLLVSIVLVTLIVLMTMDLRMGVAIPPVLVDEFTDTVNKRQFKQAFELVRSDGSFLGRVLAAGMGRLQYGIEDAREAAFSMVENVKAGKEQLITYMGTIGTLGPLLGLVGTVFGMIMAFMELSTGQAPRADKLAEGISHALVVTLLGISLSVPAIFCHAFFKSRLTRLTMDTSLLADDLLTQMYHNSKKAPATPGAAATPATAKTSTTTATDQRGIKPATKSSSDLGEVTE
ncbi:MAG TPA: MotA/TolQ/ExbB proton channel family protein [Gemmataceae bacterium]|nr:MotA/TolQ/ExbB proton channel family protein [Gemmataceae bacterium]